MKLRLTIISLLFIIVLYLTISVSSALENLPQEYYAFIEGQVVYSSGEALSGVKISAYNQKLGGYSTLTDEGGNYRLEVPSEWKAFPGTPYKIFISKENFPALDDSIRLIQQKTYKRNYTLGLDKDSLSLKGIVYYKDIHIPIEGARVTLRPKGSKDIISFSDSNQKGEFQLYLPGSLKDKKNQYVMAAEKEGYISFEKLTNYEKDKLYKVYLEDITAPLAPVVDNDTFITNKNTFKLCGKKEPQSAVYINNLNKVKLDNKTTWTADVSLAEEENNFSLYLEDAAGNKGPLEKITITKDIELPLLLKIHPANHTVLDAAQVSINGILTDNAGLKSLEINNQKVALSDEGVFRINNINLNTGKNIFVIKIEDRAGNVANYGYELFSQLYVEGENIENRKVNQPEIPTEEFNTPTDNPFTATTKDLRGSLNTITPSQEVSDEVIIESEEVLEVSQLTGSTPFFSAKKTPESNSNNSSHNNGEELIVFSSPYDNQVFSDDKLIIAGKYTSPLVEEITVNGQKCTLDKENMSFVGPMLIAPAEAKELGITKNSKDYILINVNQATHSGKNTLRCEVKLDGRKENKEITYYYYQFFVKRDAYQHDTAEHKFEKNEIEDQCYNFNLFNNPPYALWEEIEMNSRSRHPCSIRNNKWTYSLQEASPWYTLSDIPYLNWYDGNKCENAKTIGETNYTIHTLPKIDHKLTPMVLLFNDCRFVEMYIAKDFKISKYKINKQELRSANNSINDGTFFVILDKYPPDSDMLLNVEASYHDAGSNNKMQSWFSFNTIEILQGDILVDSDNDGVLGGEDNQVEMESSGHIFWVNNDDDYDESKMHEDDENATNSNGNDSKDEYINGIRDLEDFTPITINIPNISDFKESSGIKFYLEMEGSGSINIFKRAAAEYLTKLDDSIKQYKEIKLHTLSKNENKVELNIDDFLSDNRFYGIFEGVKEGEITLKLIAQMGNSADSEELVLDEVKIELRDIKDFYKYYSLRSELKPAYGNKYVNNGVEIYSIIEESGNFFPENPEKILIWTHGYKNNDKQAREWFATVFKRMYHSGFRGGFIGVTWNSDHDGGDFDKCWSVSFQSGPAFAEIVEKISKEYPDALIDLGAHSLGNNIIAYANRLLSTKKSVALNKIYHMQAAIPGNAYGGSDLDVDFFYSMYKINSLNISHKIYNSYSINDIVLYGLFKAKSWIGTKTPLDNNFDLINLSDSNCISRSSKSSALGCQKVSTFISGKFGNYDSFMRDRPELFKHFLNRPYRINGHSSMREEYLCDVSEFYNFILMPDWAIEQQTEE